MSLDAPLNDHHGHAVARGALDRAELESFLTESDRPPPAGCTMFDALLGIAVRQRCAPALGLPAGVDPAEYVARRAELGGEEANRRLLGAAGLEALLVDTGLGGDEMLGLGELGAFSGATVREVVRLEAVAEDLAASGVGAAEFEGAFGEALRRRAAGAVAVKSIIAYRHGLDFDPRPPSSAEVVKAAGRWLTGGRSRVHDGVLLRHVLWEGLATGLPLQLHTGFGDPDEDLARCDPALLTGFLRACADAGPPVLLLHCYPYHRHAAYLAAVMPHVYLDVGLAIPHVGGRAAAVLAETLELAPFHKLLYSSDAYGLAELYLLGAVGFRDAVDEVLEELAIGLGERDRIAQMIGSGNARRVYGLAG
ncbi:MAG: amidohydrolase family protein [Solirubrobacteraceae bacterium]